MGNTYEKEELKKALDTLHEWTKYICRGAGKSDDVCELFWKKLKAYPEILREYAYYHDTGDFLCEYNVENYTVADIMIWQIDHFRSHMDRLDNVNRGNNCSLIFDTFLYMIKLRENPKELISAFESETGTDLASGWTVGG